MTGLSLEHGEPKIGLPSILLTATEPMRAGLDLLVLCLRIPTLATAPRGDGHIVMVLPGFATADPTTLALRQYLRFLGYDSRPWGLGYNTGYNALGHEVEPLIVKLREAYETQRLRVSLIGWSLGGVMARRLAREHPHMVRQVISLSSPFTGNPEAVALRRVYERISGERIASREGQARFERDRVAPKVRTTAIWSRADGITNWQNCCEDRDAHVRNIEVRGSHLGMTHNLEVFIAVADLLSQSDD